MRAAAKSAGLAACTRCPAGIVTSSQFGMSAVMPASWFWSTWLAGPPAMTSAGAWISGSSSRQELTCGSVNSLLSAVTSQSKGSGPSGRVRTRRAARPWRRGVFQDQAGDAAGVPCRVQVGGPPAECPPSATCSSPSASANAARSVTSCSIVYGPAQSLVNFAAHIRPQFRQRDRQSMTFAFDLWSYNDVGPVHPKILQRLRAGTMPCDGAWASDGVAVFQRRVESGTRP